MRAETKAERWRKPRLVQRVFLHTDKPVAYRRLMGIMNMLRTGEYLKVAFVGLEVGSR